MVDFNALVPWRNNKTKTAKRDDYVVPFVTFRREMDRMFEDLTRGLGRSLPGETAGFLNPVVASAPRAHATSGEPRVERDARPGK